MDLLLTARRLDSPRFVRLLFWGLALSLAVFCLSAARSAYTVRVLSSEQVETMDAGDSWTLNLVEEKYGKRRSYITIQAFPTGVDTIGLYHRRLMLYDSVKDNFMVLPSEMVMLSRFNQNVEPLTLQAHNFSRMNNHDVAIRGLLPMNTLDMPYERYEICALAKQEGEHFVVIKSGRRLNQAGHP